MIDLFCRYIPFLRIAIWGANKTIHLYIASICFLEDDCFAFNAPNEQFGTMTNCPGVRVQGR